MLPASGNFVDSHYRSQAGPKGRDQTKLFLVKLVQQLRHLPRHWNLETDKIRTPTGGWLTCKTITEAEECELQKWSHWMVIIIVMIMTKIAELTESLLRARRCTLYFTGIDSLNPDNNPMRLVTHILWGAERFHNLPRFMQLLNQKNQTQAVRCQSPHI